MNKSQLLIKRDLAWALRFLKMSHPLSKANDLDSFASGYNAASIEDLYISWKRNPESVEASWNAFFSDKTQLHFKKLPGTRKLRKSSSKRAPFGSEGAPAAARTPAIASKAPALQASATPAAKTRAAPPADASQAPALSASVKPATASPAPVPPAPVADWKNIDDHHTVQAIIRAYQMRGHLAADLDPLGIVGPGKSPSSVDGVHRQATEEVLRQHFSYIFGDLNAMFKLPSSTYIGGDEKFLPLREILDRLERSYCGHIGVEFMHMTSLINTTWIRKRFEKPSSLDFSKAEKKKILERLSRATGFENFLHKKFTSEKRFGLEGCDIMVPVIDEVVDRSAKAGVESFFIGMAHRGRLNVLANICRRSIADILSQFHSLEAVDPGSGDVKYHLGLYQERLNKASNRMIRITVVANPSHLEHVNPVLQGKARAEMDQGGGTSGEKVLPIIVHGDASFCGQGVVFESMHLSDLPNYTTYGTIHIVSNNQVGFTTDPRFSRSSRYCTDVAKVVNAPIFHVNADDPEACIYCARIAADFRAKFKKSAVIDIVGYRRNGHNEADEPMFTQPLMYQNIQKKKPCLELYAEKLIKEGIVTDSEYKEMVAEYNKFCEDAWAESKKLKTIKHSTWIDSPWPGFFEGRDPLLECPTGVSEDTLEKIGTIFSSLPPPERKFNAHRGIKRILSQRKKMVDDRVADWCLGEAFAFGSLLKEGIQVRLSGQDVERGTFSHRHHVLHHQTADKTVYVPLKHLYADQADYSVSNSSLSECAVLAFEHGYSMASPYALVLWEGQYGDFCNTAQCIIDQFIASGESKWVRQSGVVLLLPHSMEGNGPEHSSGRMERFLQMSDDDPDIYPDTSDKDFVMRQLMDINWIVTNLTTPANLFHCLRRQMKMGFRKPLINFSPKSVLRHPMARSPFEDFNKFSSFQRLIPEKGAASENPENVTKLIFCSGKVYYDLFKERDDHEQVNTVAIVRVEQICPFPYDLIMQQLELYPKAELLWAQEEHKNSGAWSYVQPRFDTLLLQNENETRCVSYHGRGPSSSPATGNKRQHFQEYKVFMNSIFGKLTEENKARLKSNIKKQQAKAKAEFRASLKNKSKGDAAPPGKIDAKQSQKPSNPKSNGKDVVSVSESKASPAPAAKGAPPATAPVAPKVLPKRRPEESSRGLETPPEPEF